MLTEIKKEELPEELKKEILILYELGLEDYEIEYILYVKNLQILEHVEIQQNFEHCQELVNS